MPDPYYLLKEQDKITARQAELREELARLDKDWWDYEDLLTAHGEKQP